MIAIVDYGAGNVGSVLRAVQYLGYAAEAVRDPAKIEAADRIILPGQGHFGNMMQALKDTELIEPLRAQIGSGKAFFGICLGLQALYESSEEQPGLSGFGLVPGSVKRFEGVFKIPHVGWSQLEIENDRGLFKGITNGSFAYFCHSYYGPLVAGVSATTEYGQRFAAAIESGPVWAVQFHPEKSGEVGLAVLRNFLNQE